MDVRSEPVFKGLLATYPDTPITEGMPHLTPELRWAPGVDVFVSGAYAALQLGPGALNIAGEWVRCCCSGQVCMAHGGTAGPVASQGAVYIHVQFCAVM